MRKATVSKNRLRVAATRKMSPRCPWMKAQTTTTRGQTGFTFGVQKETGLLPWGSLQTYHDWTIGSDESDEEYDDPTRRTI